MIAFCYHLAKSTKNNNSGWDCLSYHDTETKQMICSANQLTGFYMMGTFAFNELMFHFLKSNFQWYHTKLSSVEKPEYFVLFSIILRKWETTRFSTLYFIIFKKQITHACGLTLMSLFIKIMMGNYETCPVITPKLIFFWRGNYGKPFLTIWHHIGWDQFHISKVHYLFVFTTQTNKSVLNWMVLILIKQNIILKTRNQDFPWSKIE